MNQLLKQQQKDRSRPLYEQKTQTIRRRISKMNETTRASGSRRASEKLLIYFFSIFSSTYSRANPSQSRVIPCSWKFMKLKLIIHRFSSILINGDPTNNQRKATIAMGCNYGYKRGIFGSCHQKEKMIGIQMKNLLSHAKKIHVKNSAQRFS